MLINSLVRVAVLLSDLNKLNREKFPCPRLRLKNWFCETGLAVPSRVSLLILYTNAESGAYSRDFFRYPRRRSYIFTTIHHRVITTLSGHAIAYRWRSLPRVRCVQTLSLLYYCCTYCGPVSPPRLMSVQVLRV